jgi:hypothetical protein
MRSNIGGSRMGSSASGDESQQHRTANQRENSGRHGGTSFPGVQRLRWRLGGVGCTDPEKGCPGQHLKS